jgi:integrase/recombinase XerC
MATTKPEQGILITDAVTAVLEHWKKTDALTEKSLQKFTSLLQRYANFATKLGAVTLAQQSEELAAQWIKSRGRSRNKEIVLPADSTMNTRRAALRKFFRDAEEMKLSDTGLIVKTYVAPRPTGMARPLTNEEARLVWKYAKDAGAHTRRPVIFALLLSGVHSSEVGHITIDDVDISNQRVRAHGDTTRIKPRWVNLEEPYFTAVKERIDFVRGWLPPHYGLGTFQLTQGNFKRPHGYPQNRAASACKEVFQMVGLHKLPEITPSSVSLHAGARMLRDGERIETITKVLGYASLDSCAKALCFDWETGEIA